MDKEKIVLNFLTMNLNNEDKVAGILYDDLILYCTSIEINESGGRLILKYDDPLVGEIFQEIGLALINDYGFLKTKLNKKCLLIKVGQEYCMKLFQKHSHSKLNSLFLANKMT